MNLLKLSFYIALFATSITLAQNQTDLDLFIQSENLRPSPIAVFTSYKANIKPNANTTIIEDEKPLLHLEFDIRGNKVEESTFKRNGSLSQQSTYTYSYNTQGKLIHVLKFSDGVLHGRQSYKYDQEGNRIELLLYSPDDSLIFQETYNFDQKGNIIEILSLTTNKNLVKTESSQFKYDSNGIKLEESIFSDDSLRERSKFDQKGNKIEFFGYRSDGSLDTHITRSFDALGNKLEELNEYFTYGKEVTYKYQYDEQGNATEYTSYDTEGDLVIRQTYSYDPQGNQTEHSKHNVDYGSLASQKRCEYEYDQYSNWIKRTCIEFVNVLGELQADYGLSFNEIIRRDIKYY